MLNRQNHLANKELQKQKKIDAGLVSERFPKVSSICIHMTHFHKASTQVLMLRTVNFSPTNYAYFNLKCLTKGCDNGGFEFSPVITRMIKKRETTTKGKLTCSGKTDSLSSNHAKINYEIGIKYSNKKSR
jgi:hypothetical protein